MGFVFEVSFIILMYNDGVRCVLLNIFEFSCCFLSVGEGCCYSGRFEEFV